MKWKQYDCNKINLSSDWQKNVKTQDGRRVKLTFQNAVSIGGVIEGCNDDGKPVESLIAWDKFTGYAPGSMQLVMVEDETKLEMKMTIKEELCQVNHQLEAVRLKLKLQEHLACNPHTYITMDAFSALKASCEQDYQRAIQYGQRLPGLGATTFKGIKW